MQQQELEPGPGIILIAHPWLPDPNFQRTVVFLCEHRDEEGSFGLVLSRKLPGTIGDVVDTLSGAVHELFLGGPVQTDTLHYLHSLGGQVEDAIEVQNELYWGGDFDLIQALVLSGDIGTSDIRFFAGYSGWGEGQLRDEIDEGSWILTRAPTEIILETESDRLWQTLLRRMGGPFALLSNFPTDPRRN